VFAGIRESFSNADGCLLAIDTAAAVPVPTSCGFHAVMIFSTFKETAEATEQRL